MLLVGSFVEHVKATHNGQRPCCQTRRFLLEGARASRLFAHRLVCTLASEGRPPAGGVRPRRQALRLEAPARLGAVGYRGRGQGPGPFLVLRLGSDMV